MTAVVAVLFALGRLRGAPTTFFFLRHGETVANASGRYSGDTLNRFSALGESEIRDATTELLRKGPFDLILVSPSPRALHTIEPYLVKTHRHAVVWPLLYECCTGHRPTGAKPTRFFYGSQIRLTGDLEKYFSLMPGESRFPNSPTYSAGLAQVQASVDEFNRKYRGRKVLLVGHSGQGGHMIRALTGKWVQLKNAQLREIEVN